MSTNNKARRAAKARKRRERDRARRATAQDHEFEPDFTTVELVHFLWEQALHAPSPTSAPAQRAIAGLLECPASVVDGAVAELCLAVLGSLWTHGWQPTEVLRQARRADAATARFVGLAVLADDHRRRGQRMDPRWAAQLLQLGPSDVAPTTGWATRWQQHEELDRAAWYAFLVRTLRLLAGLPALQCLIPPPDAPADATVFGPTADSGSGHPALERIRKLLAKAEATNYEEEAATFTAKAQELMTRHAIDAATVEAGGTRSARPVVVRLPIDAPYADAKAVLLSVVASANRCRSVNLGKLGMSTVLGHPEDLGAVELLFTSLLVQAQKALTQAGSGPAGGRTRSSRFRSSFYLGYAGRIGERLDAANAQVVAEADARALPVLRSREESVDDYVDELYGDTLIAAGVRGGYDLAGQRQGRDAADEAVLVGGRIG